MNAIKRESRENSECGPVRIRNFIISIASDVFQYRCHDVFDSRKHDFKVMTFLSRHFHGVEVPLMRFIFDGGFPAGFTLCVNPDELTFLCNDREAPLKTLRKVMMGTWFSVASHRVDLKTVSLE